jgi:hypothetical protein
LGTPALLIRQLGLGQVADDHQGLGAARAAGLGHLLQPVRAPRHQRQVRPALGEVQGELVADARGGPGDDDRASLIVQA